MWKGNEMSKSKDGIAREEAIAKVLKTREDVAHAEAIQNAANAMVSEFPQLGDSAVSAFGLAKG